MNYETIRTIEDVWCPTTKEFLSMDIYYDICVEDGSFSHDWAGGGTEHCTEATVENLYYGFQYKGKAVLFDPDSNYECLLDIDVFTLGAIGYAEEQSILEAINWFEHPEYGPLMD